MVFFGPRAHFDLCEKTCKLRAPEGTKDPVDAFRRGATTAEGMRETGDVVGLVSAKDVTRGVLCENKDQGYYFTAFHEFIASSDTMTVERVFIRWKAGASAEKCKAHPAFTEQYTYEHTRSEEDERTLALTIKVNSLYQHSGIVNYTPYIKPDIEAQLARVVALLEKLYPLDPEAPPETAVVDAAVVTGEKLLSSVTLKPAVTVQGFVQTPSTAVGRPIEVSAV